MSSSVGSRLWHFSASEVTNFFRTAPRIATNRYFDALALPATHGFGRLLVVTPRRLARAPVRNKIRRKLKELFRTQHDPASLTCDVLIIIKRGGFLLSFQELGMHLEHTIQVAQSLAENKKLKPRRAKR